MNDREQNVVTLIENGTNLDEVAQHIANIACNGLDLKILMTLALRKVAERTHDRQEAFDASDRAGRQVILGQLDNMYSAYNVEIERNEQRHWELSVQHCLKTRELIGNLVGQISLLHTSQDEPDESECTECGTPSDTVDAGLPFCNECKELHQG